MLWLYNSFVLSAGNATASILAGSSGPEGVILAIGKEPIGLRLVVLLWCVLDIDVIVDKGTLDEGTIVRQVGRVHRVVRRDCDWVVDCSECCLLVVVHGGWIPWLLPTLVRRRLSWLQSIV